MTTTMMIEHASSRRVRSLFLAGAAIFFTLGVLHTLGTLADLVYPFFFAPVDDRVRLSMIGMPMGISGRTSLWAAHLGFNLSHGLGIAFFGGLGLWIGLRHRALLERADVRALAVAMTATWHTISVFFWFWAPTLGSGIALGCFAVAALSARSGAYGVAE